MLCLVQVGVVSQEPVLFATTIAENIKYGRPDASDDEVAYAAAMANADSFIRAFPHGYNTCEYPRHVGTMMQAAEVTTEPGNNL